MIKYLILPKWLYEALIRNHRDLEDVLDFDIMSSLISELELTFYIRCNNINYSLFLLSTSAKKLFKALNCSDFINYTHTIDSFIRFTPVNKNIFFDPTSINRYLLYNPIYSNRNVSSEIDFKPLLIGKDILGLIPTIKDVSDVRPSYSIRRDIYEVMYKFMSVEKIVKSSIFGI